MDILELVNNKSLDRWREFFSQEEVIEELEFINDNIADMKNIIPLPENIFKPFTIKDPKKIDVCMIFDRPYNMYDEFNKGVPISNGIGCGLVEEVSETTTKIDNIYSELSRCYRTFEPPVNKHKFDGWKRVLMLNCMMTVEAGSDNKSNIWLSFINTVISYLESNKVVFILCCGYEYEKKIKDMIKRSKIITCPNVFNKQFVGCGAFTECNRELKNNHKKSIVWTRINK